MDDNKEINNLRIEITPNINKNDKIVDLECKTINDLMFSLKIFKLELLLYIKELIKIKKDLLYLQSQEILSIKAYLTLNNKTYTMESFINIFSPDIIEIDKFIVMFAHSLFDIVIKNSLSE